MWATPKPIEMEFRDGKRVVPNHLAAALGQLETHRMTYQEALAKVNDQFTRDNLNAQMGSILSAHFRGRG